MDEPKVYRHSIWILGLVIILISAIGIAGVFGIGLGNLPILGPFAGILLLALGFTILSLTAKTVVSEEGISTSSLLGEKSLRWNEIHRVSGRGNGIRLHNFDGDVAVSPSTGLPGYEQVVDRIGRKRPDLFNPQDLNEMKRSPLGSLVTAAMFLLLLGGAAYFVMSTSEAWMIIGFLLFAALVIAVSTLAAPQAVSLAGGELTLKYFLRQRVLTRDQIRTIQMAFQRTRNGRVYFILLTLTDGSSVRISSLGPSLPIAYLTLKNWLNKDGGTQPLFR